MSGAETVSAFDVGWARNHMRADADQLVECWRENRKGIETTDGGTIFC